MLDDLDCPFADRGQRRAKLVASMAFARRADVARGSDGGCGRTHRVRRHDPVYRRQRRWLDEEALRIGPDIALRAAADELSLRNTRLDRITLT